MSKIIISAAGWCEADPEKIRFQLISDMDDQAYITGAEWLELPEEGDKNQAGREDYILECVGVAFESAIDGEYDYVDVEVQE